MLLNLVDDELPSKLADLLKVPKEKRAEFVKYVFEFEDMINPQDPFPIVRSQRGNQTLEKAERHLRDFLDALEDTSNEEWVLIWGAAAAYSRGDLRVRTGSDFQFDGDDISTKVTYEYRNPDMVSDILRPLAKGLADLIGRNPHFPNARDWRLNALLQDMLTWPERFGTAVLKDHRSKRLHDALGILHELMPGIVPDRVPPTTIRDIWNPRKDVRNK
jgi:hypothetical protein